MHNAEDVLNSVNDKLERYYTFKQRSGCGSCRTQSRSYRAAHVLVYCFNKARITLYGTLLLPGGGVAGFIQA
jgi:hypothetical protein